MSEIDSLPMHVMLETLSVLTRLPGGLAQPLASAADLVRQAFPGALLTLPAARVPEFVSSLAEDGLGGGALYDGLVAATVRHNGARLLSLDARARPVYRAVGADVAWVA